MAQIGDTIEVVHMNVEGIGVPPPGTRGKVYASYTGAFGTTLRVSWEGTRYWVCIREDEDTYRIIGEEDGKLESDNGELQTLRDHHDSWGCSSLLRHLTRTLGSSCGLLLRIAKEKWERVRKAKAGQA